ncbi:O-antigen translocase [Geopsychrobacter electrodiphilus]|uniref:O-antigen translocase n=1 Tax=Geopsychrobacter electrodiphilus TaxID=225196 RepID=UPI00037C9997|nr:O-antigen translocase [Geopsychrobacter electrodiphilus]
MDGIGQTDQESSSFRNILKSTSLIGGSSVLNILIGMISTKFAALWLGPSGVGLLATFGRVTALVATLTGMGIDSSGVRQVAEAVGSKDDERIVRTVITLRRAAWMTGGIGLLVMAIFCVPISWLTFNTEKYAWPIAVLGITVFAGAIMGGQCCILTGTRRIRDLAKVSVIGSFFGVLFSIPCFYLWGQTGIVPSLVLTAFASLVVSWWFVRKVPIGGISLTWRESYDEARQLLSLGVSFMGAGLVLALSNYFIYMIMLRRFGLVDVGIYQAAFSLSGVLVGFVLGAMGTDYYPRMTAVANDNASVYRMVNEQTQISILLSLPVLAAMMIFAPLVIKLFYTTSFGTAVPVMRWCILGVLGRVFSWPMAYVLLAKGKGKVFLITEIFVNSLHLAGVYFFTQIWGLEGAGIAFLGMYVIYTLLMLFVTCRLVLATWDKYSQKIILFASITLMALFLNSTFNKNIISEWAIDGILLPLVTCLCLRELSRKSKFSLKTLINKTH